MWKFLIFVFMFIESVFAFAGAKSDYDLLKKYAKKDDYVNAGKVLGRILAVEESDHTELVGRLYRCGDIYFKLKKYWAAYVLYDLALNTKSPDDQFESFYKKRLKKISDFLGITDGSRTLIRKTIVEISPEGFGIKAAKCGATGLDNLPKNLNWDFHVIKSLNKKD